MRRLVRPSYQPSFSRALGAFVDRINGRSVALPTVEDGVRSLAVVLAAEESAAAKGPRDGCLMPPLRVLMITDWMPSHGGAEVYAQARSGPA